MILIDREPPRMTGNASQDARALRDYLMYLQQQLNFILTQLQKGGANGSES